MITQEMLDDLGSRSSNMLSQLDAPPTWLCNVVEAYNSVLQDSADPNTGYCNSLLIRLLSDRQNSQPPTVPAITNLLQYYKSLPEFSARAWSERRAAILADKHSSFHSALTEISLHFALSKFPDLGVNFIDPTPGRGNRPDYQLTFPDDHQMKAELKAIHSEQVRAQEGTHFVGSLDQATAKMVWRKFTAPFSRGQLDSTKPSAVFVDISYCDELFLFFQAAHPSSNLQSHTCKLLSQMAARHRSVTKPNTDFFICGFDPYSFGLHFIHHVPVP